MFISSKEVMMKFVSTALLFALVMNSNTLLARRVSGSQDAKWKQIIVLQSTRSDVEKLFGKSKYQGYSVSYDVEEDHLNIEYAGFNFCDGKEFGWNVSEWTVVEITYRPHQVSQFSSLNLDLTRFKKVRESPCCPDLITYINNEEGVAYTVNPSGTLNNIRYFPSSQYDHLRCGKQPQEPS